MTTSDKPPRNNRNTLKTYLKLEAAAVADTIRPVVKTVLWLPRTVPMTIGLVVLLCIIHRLATLEGGIEVIRAAWGHDPGKPLSWFTHDRTLIRYLMRHHHTTPFEMCEIKLHVKLPIFVARQWVRHRTANINEYSARYSILDREFYIPDPEVITSQSEGNRQGRGGGLVPAEQAAWVQQLLTQDATRAYDHYGELLNQDSNGYPLDPNRDGLARELRWYPKLDNWLRESPAPKITGN